MPAIKPTPKPLQVAAGILGTLLMVSGGSNVA